jgi:LemA protein
VEILIVLVVIGLIVAFVVGLYNRLVTLRQRVREAWADIDVQLKRRWDLIPNLVETVKGYAAHERQTFEAVTQARSAAMAAAQTGSPEQRAQAENALGAALLNLRAVAEAYPQLQAIQEFKDLSENLTATEDKIAFARRFYNGNVRDYNTAIQTVPTNIIAGMFAFTAEQYFELTDPTQREVPKVSFS